MIYRAVICKDQFQYAQNVLFTVKRIQLSSPISETETNKERSKMSPSFSLSLSETCPALH